MTSTNQIFQNTLSKFQTNSNVTNSNVDSINKAMPAVLSKPVNIEPEEEYDRIIRILNIFARAYKMYATDYIRSGRPNARISLSTFREYEYIGSKDNVPEWKEDVGPGYGPWADKSVYETWNKAVMKILEDPKLRVVLANTTFVSKPETDTNTEMNKKPKSGVTLLSFIEEVINSKGSFKDIRSKIMKKYFNVPTREVDDTYSANKEKDKDTTIDENILKFVNIEESSWKSKKILRYAVYRIQYDYDDLDTGGNVINNKKDKSMILHVLDVEKSKTKNDDWIVVIQATTSSDNSVMLHQLVKDKDSKLDSSILNIPGQKGSEISLGSIRVGRDHDIADMIGKEMELVFESEYKNVSKITNVTKVRKIVKIRTVEILVGSDKKAFKSKDKVNNITDTMVNTMRDFIR